MVAITAVEIPVTAFAATTPTRLVITPGNNHDVSVMIPLIHPSISFALAITAELNLHVRNLGENDRPAGGR